MKVAFASEDGVHIDAHFGRSKRMFFYEVDPEGYRFASELAFLEGQGGPESEDKLNGKIEALDGCAIVYMAQIGPSAAARLVGKRIHPVKAKETDEILDVLKRLVAMLGTNPPPWIRKILVREAAP
jgi:nitrogen fixation protein NifX